MWSPWAVISIAVRSRWCSHGSFLNCLLWCHLAENRLSWVVNFDVLRGQFCSHIFTSPRLCSEMPQSLSLHISSMDQFRLTYLSTGYVYLPGIECWMHILFPFMECTRWLSSRCACWFICRCVHHELSGCACHCYLRDWQMHFMVHHSSSSGSVIVSIRGFWFLDGHLQYFDSHSSANK